MESARAELEELRSRTESGAQSARVNAERLTHEHTKALEQLKVEVATCRKEADSLRASVSALEEEKKSLQADKDLMKEGQLLLSESKSAVLSELCGLKEHMFKVKEENSALLRQMEDIKKDCKRQMQALQMSIEEDVDQLERKNEDLDKEKMSWGVERAELVARMESGNVALDILQAEMDVALGGLNKELVQRDEKLSDLQIKMAASEATCQDIQEQSKQKLSKCAHTLEKERVEFLAGMERAAQQAVEQSFEAQQQIEAITDERDSLNASLVQARSRCGAITAAVSRHLVAHHASLSLRCVRFAPQFSACL